MMSYANLTCRVAVLGVALIGCRPAPQRGPSDTTRVDSATSSVSLPSNPGPAVIPARPQPVFAALPMLAGRPFRDQLARMGADRLTLLLKLNRVDLDHVRAGDTLFLPADSVATEFDVAPFPDRLPRLDSMPKFLVVSQRIQAFAAYQFGHLVYWGPTSTGKRSTPTPNGLFFTTWKAKETRSTDNDEWLLKWYFNFENQRGVSFHQFDLPGHPASHACVRLLAPDAEWIYRWAEQWQISTDGRRVLTPGTPVLVFGEYRFDEPGPWRLLVENPSAARVDSAEVLTALTEWSASR